MTPKQETRTDILERVSIPNYFSPAKRETDQSIPWKDQVSPYRAGNFQNPHTNDMEVNNN